MRRTGMCQCRGGQGWPGATSCTGVYTPLAPRRLSFFARDCAPILPGACYFCPGLRALSSRRLPFLSGIACAPQEVPLGCTRLSLFQRASSLFLEEPANQIFPIADSLNCFSIEG